MNSQVLFSKIKSNDQEKNEDSKRFRPRLLKYLENFVNKNSPEIIVEKCALKIGIDIEIDPHIDISIFAKKKPYFVEKTFNDKSINDILDFVMICYASLEPDQKNKSDLSAPKKNILTISMQFSEKNQCATF